MNVFYFYDGIFGVNGQKRSGMFQRAPFNVDLVWCSLRGSWAGFNTISYIGKYKWRGGCEIHFLTINNKYLEYLFWKWKFGVFFVIGFQCYPEIKYETKATSIRRNMKTNNIIFAVQCCSYLLPFLVLRIRMASHKSSTKKKEY